MSLFFLECAKMYFQDFFKKKNILGNNFSKIQKLSSVNSSCQVALRITGKNLRSTPGSKIQKIRFSLIVSSVTFFIQNNLLLSFLSCWIFEIHFEEHLRINYFLRTHLSIANHFNVSYLVLMGYNIRISHI